MVRIPEAEAAPAGGIGLSFTVALIGTAGGIALAGDGAIGAICGFNVVAAGGGAAAFAPEGGGGAVGFASRAGGMVGGRTADGGGGVVEIGAVGLVGAKVVFASVTEIDGGDGAMGGTRFSSAGAGALEAAGAVDGGSLGGAEDCCVSG